jgi:hypothetical protein
MTGIKQIEVPKHIGKKLARSGAIFAAACLVLSTVGCSSVSNEALGEFSLDATSFSGDWAQEDQDAGSGYFTGDRVGDICQLEFQITEGGGVLAGSPKMITSPAEIGGAGWDGTERNVYSALYSFESGGEVEAVLKEINDEIESCSFGDSRSSNENGIISSSSDTRTLTEVKNVESEFGLGASSVIAFDYVRVESSMLLNTNNDYSDDSEYTSQGRFIVVSGPSSILLVGSVGNNFAKYKPAPVIEEQNTQVADMLKAIFRG